MGRFECSGAETGGIGDFLAAERTAKMLGNVEKGVECSVRHRAFDAGKLVQSLAYEVAPRLELLAHLFDVRLISLERRNGRILADARWIARLLALHVAHGLYQVQRPDSPAHAPAGH